MSSPKSLIFNHLDPIERSTFNSQADTKKKLNFEKDGENYQNNFKMKKNENNKDRNLYNEYLINENEKLKNLQPCIVNRISGENQNHHTFVNQKNNEPFFNLAETKEIDPIFSGSFLTDLQESYHNQKDQPSLNLESKNIISNENKPIDKECSLNEDLIEFFNERASASSTILEKSFYYAKIEKRRLGFQNWVKSRRISVFSVLSCPFETKVAIFGMIWKNERLSAFYLKENLLTYLAGREDEEERRRWEEEADKPAEKEVEADQEKKEKEEIKLSGEEEKRQEEEGEKRWRQDVKERRGEANEDSISLEDNSGRVELIFKRKVKWGLASGFEMAELFKLNYLINGVVVMVIGELREAEEAFLVEEIVFESFSVQNEAKTHSSEQIKKQNNTILEVNTNMTANDFQIKNDFLLVKSSFNPILEPKIQPAKSSMERLPLISNLCVQIMDKDNNQKESSSLFDRMASSSNLINFLTFPPLGDLDSFICRLESYKQKKSLCLVISGFELDLMENIKIFELMAFLEGSAIAKKIKIIILMGNFVHEREEIKIGLKSNFIDKKCFSMMNEHLKSILKRFSSIIKQLASFCVKNRIELILMPDEDDIKVGEFTKKSEFHQKNVYKANNARVLNPPLEFKFKENFIFCSSALPIKNMKKYVNYQNDSEQEIIKKLLFWGNYFPIHTVYGNFNPIFDFHKNENILIFGGCDNFQFKLLKEKTKEVLMVCVPEIKMKNTFVIVDMEHLACFEVGLGVT